MIVIGFATGPETTRLGSVAVGFTQWNRFTGPPFAYAPDVDSFSAAVRGRGYLERIRSRIVFNPSIHTLQCSCSRRIGDRGQLPQRPKV